MRYLLLFLVVSSCARAPRSDARCKGGPCLSYLDKYHRARFVGTDSEPFPIGLVLFETQRAGAVSADCRRADQVTNDTSLAPSLPLPPSVPPFLCLSLPPFLSLLFLSLSLSLLPLALLLSVSPLPPSVSPLPLTLRLPVSPLNLSLSLPFIPLSLPFPSLSPPSLCLSPPPLELRLSKSFRDSKDD